MPDSSPPPLDTLLAKAIPFQDADELLKGIAAAWREAFSIQTVGLLWADPCTLSGWFAVAGNDSQLIRYRIEQCGDSHVLMDRALQSFHSLHELNWHRLDIDEEIVGYLGLEGAVDLVVPEEWINATARLCGMIQVFERSLHEAKLRAMAEFAAGAGHEINNPLAAIRGRAEQLLSAEQDISRRHLLETIGAQTLRIRDMIGDTMLFARPPAPDLAEVNLTEVISDAVGKLIDQFRQRKISLWGQRESVVTTCGDRLQLSIVIFELVRNALDALPDGGRVIIDCLYKDGEQLPCVVRVADNGTKFSDVEREHCFDPFFSGRQAGRGLGFGLPKCWRIVTGHGGVITLVDSEETAFVIRLPGLI